MSDGIFMKNSEIYALLLAIKMSVILIRTVINQRQFLSNILFKSKILFYFSLTFNAMAKTQYTIKID